MTSFMFRVDHADTGHIHFAVFAGVDRDHRGKAGDLVLTPQEFVDLHGSLRPELQFLTADANERYDEVIG